MPPISDAPSSGGDLRCFFPLVRTVQSEIQPHKRYIIPEHQFGFRSQHATTEQVCRIVNAVRTAFERKRHCPGVFLDVKQAFDRVWLEGLIHEISEYLPEQTVQLSSSYLFDRSYVVHYGDAKSDTHPILAGVPEGSILGPLLYLLYTSDIPTTKHTITATFADDTAILAPHNDYNEAITALQHSLNKVSSWARK